MKRITPILLALTIVAFSSSAFAMDFAVSKGNVKFVSNAKTEKIVGTSEKLAGKFSINVEDATKTTGTISVPVKSFNTGNKLRDRHLASKSWLNAKANPNITFTVESLKDVTKSGDAAKTVFTAVAVGKASFNGVAKEATAKVKITVVAAKKIAKVEFSGLTVKIKEHGVKGKPGSIGTAVANEIKIEGAVYGKGS